MCNLSFRRFSEDGYYCIPSRRDWISSDRARTRQIATIFGEPLGYISEPNKTAAEWDFTISFYRRQKGRTIAAILKKMPPLEVRVESSWTYSKVDPNNAKKYNELLKSLSFRFFSFTSVTSPIGIKSLSISNYALIDQLLDAACTRIKHDHGGGDRCGKINY